MMNWSPGPWEKFYEEILDGKGFNVASTTENGRDVNELIANQKLISAAPELYEAVCALLSASPSDPQPNAYEKARRAIEKAEGRA